MKKKLFTIVLTLILISNANAGLFSSKIKIKDCFRTEMGWKSFEDMKGSGLLEPVLSAEIDLKKETVVVTSIMDNKVTMSKHFILAKTDEYISTVQDPIWGSWLFDLKRKGMTGQNVNFPNGSNTIRCIGDCVHKCKFK